MPNWVNKFEQHALHKSIESVLVIIQDIRNISELGSDEIEDVDRIFQFINYAINAIANSDVILISLPSLDNLNNIMVNINSDLVNFKSDKNKQHLINTNSRIDSCLPIFSQMIAPVRTIDVEGTKEAVISFRKSVGQFIRHIDDEHKGLVKGFTELSQKNSELNNSIESQKARLDNAIAQFQQQFSQAEDTRRNQYSQSDLTRNQEFTEFIKKAKDEQISIIEELKDSVKTLTDDMEQENEVFQHRLDENVNSYIETLNKYKEQAEKLVFAITNTGMVGGYQRVANEERDRARRWHIISIISLIGLILFAIYAFAFTLQTNFNIAMFSGRLFVAFTFATLAAYSMRLADKHEDTERMNRKMELELSSIEPFLVSLPVETQNKIKEVMAERFFGKNDITFTKKDKNSKVYDVNITNSLIDLLKDLAKTKLQ